MNTPVTFDIAKLLKEKEFDLTTRKYYEHSLTERYNGEDGYSGPFGWKKGETTLQEGYHINNSKFDNSNDNWFLCSAPTVSEVVMWLYEKYGIWISITIGHDEDKIWFNAYIEKVEFGYNYEPLNIENDIDGETPTEAYLAAIEYTLNNLI